MNDSMDDVDVKKDPMDSKDKEETIGCDIAKGQEKENEEDDMKVDHDIVQVKDERNDKDIKKKKKDSEVDNELDRDNGDNRVSNQITENK